MVVSIWKGLGFVYTKHCLSEQCMLGRDHNRERRGMTANISCDLQLCHVWFVVAISFFAVVMMCTFHQLSGESHSLHMSHQGIWARNFKFASCEKRVVDGHFVHLIYGEEHRSDGSNYSSWKMFAILAVPIFGCILKKILVKWFVK